jgi:hypothetical protein
MAQMPWISIGAPSMSTSTAAKAKRFPACIRAPKGQ